MKLKPMKYGISLISLRRITKEDAHTTKRYLYGRYGAVQFRLLHNTLNRDLIRATYKERRR